MKIGILELLAGRLNPVSPGQYLDHFFARKQYASVMPQAISAWCRQMGHVTFYATYYGLGDPKNRLPPDLDLVFICTHSFSAPLAYGLARAYQREGTLTVIGGPHAKSYPQDCLRYFDLVVLECDQTLIADIVGGQFDPPAVISSPRPLAELPSIAERLPEIRTATFLKGKPFPGSFIPLLTSLGCPYTCDFCSDWNSPYRSLSPHRLKADLQFIAQNLPGVKLAIFDPNFGVRFDEVMGVFESIPPNRRSPYVIESSLSLLNPERIKRLHRTRCAAMMPGVESWSAYSHKAGVGRAILWRKLEGVVEQFYLLKDYIPYLGVNFILGLDLDAGDEPFELTREFMYRTPFVWPSINIPMAFGGTPLFDTLLAGGRILNAMPFTFYTIPYLTVILKNYDPLTYFQKMVDLYALLASPGWLTQRLASMSYGLGKAVHCLRTLAARSRLQLMRTMVEQLQTDAHFYAFHAGQTDVLPHFYAVIYTRQLGPYIELVPLAESRPVLDGTPEILM
ncbi:MAG: radical SAM protein [Anaerolineae bacterium]|nr:radical SAM protein [Anaerolineae bacterium]